MVPFDDFDNEEDNWSPSGDEDEMTSLEWHYRRGSTYGRTQARAAERNKPVPPMPTTADTVRGLSDFHVKALLKQAELSAAGRFWQCQSRLMRHIEALRRKEEVSGTDMKSFAADAEAIESLPIEELIARAGKMDYIASLIDIEAKQAVSDLAKTLGLHDALVAHAETIGPDQQEVATGPAKTNRVLTAKLQMTDDAQAARGLAPAETDILTVLRIEELDKATSADLKAELKTRGLPANGNKGALLGRLISYLLSDGTLSVKSIVEPVLHAADKASLRRALSSYYDELDLTDAFEFVWPQIFATNEGLNCQPSTVREQIEKLIQTMKALRGRFISDSGVYDTLVEIHSFLLTEYDAKEIVSMVLHAEIRHRAKESREAAIRARGDAAAGLSSMHYQPAGGTSTGTGDGEGIHMRISHNDALLHELRIVSVGFCESEGYCALGRMK
ncbi:uncharacterized protein L969DRAFT_70680 [Mixia osmundae IAM 14324]|uniref:SAP domain-containing protein n=1 Tax=Mixia osmundae (strain CBS 9802 / IAM 14324 / JCM 22182 / KY 12970) TaxID=764103 RepID=G7DXE1_MIXOS|nr:uncharacterized protein L969DRAFT_70680 [Mixia osmundae IAM 14324]KEI41255.1 hypothetical protein L969DRAFT_70680 [Mixia osmundae IAM 14324]GAA95251.1 hypothetical protein E5Q_01907 [Mixia osmundae IAM 14324]